MLFGIITNTQVILVNNAICIMGRITNKAIYTQG